MSDWIPWFIICLTLSVQMLSSPFLELPRLDEEEYWVCLVGAREEYRSDCDDLEPTDSALPRKELLMDAFLCCKLEGPEEMVDNLLCWYGTIGRVSSSSLENEVLSLFKLDVEFRLQKDDKATGLEAHPLSMLDMELRLPLVGLRSCGDPTEFGVDGCGR